MTSRVEFSIHSGARLAIVKNNMRSGEPRYRIEKLKKSKEQSLNFLINLYDG